MLLCGCIILSVQTYLHLFYPQLPVINEKKKPMDDVTLWTLHHFRKKFKLQSLFMKLENCDNAERGRNVW